MLGRIFSTPWSVRAPQVDVAQMPSLVRFTQESSSTLPWHEPSRLAGSEGAKHAPLLLIGPVY